MFHSSFSLMNNRRLSKTHSLSEKPLKERRKTCKNNAPLSLQQSNSSFVLHEIWQMLKQKYGAIVNCSSVGAFKAVPGFAAYDASKTGLFGLTRAAALECATSGIRVNVICPGPTTRTSLMDNLTSAHPEEKEKILSIIPMMRMAQPEEMAEAVIWLCSDAASFVTGHIMPVDGGMTSQ